MDSLPLATSTTISKQADKEVRLRGWVERIRRHGKVTFFDVRDYDGLTQVVFTGKLLESSEKATPESVVEVAGVVVKRPLAIVNKNIASGTVELQAKKLTILSQAKTLPFPIDGSKVDESVRLKYRYLDLRNPNLSRNIKLRSAANLVIRDFLGKEGFLEVETPYISKSTPEGARDYLVPSRIEPGKFYALPQSPQQYKQLLMVAGVEKYFQIARCFRDEDSRGDRQPEFTQLDIEMAFAEQEDVLAVAEEVVKKVVTKVCPSHKLTFETFPRLSYREVISKHKTDKPDLRRDKNNNKELAFAFVVDFPLFEWSKERQRFQSSHHPFTRPQKDFIDNFESKPEQAISTQYDLVLNGAEIAGGSLRISEPELLEKVFAFLGHKKGEIQEKFGHLLEAFSYGVPPHGGIAFGLDRLYAILCAEESIREVIAFPKAGDGRDLMMSSPSEVDPEQLKELGLKLDS